jgi:hypothetical protein
METTELMEGGVVREPNRKRLLTSAEAVEWIRSAPRGSRFCVHLRIDAPTVGLDGLPDGKHFSDAAVGCVRLTGHEALELVRTGLSPILEGKGARWPCRRNDYELLGKKRIVYWIG